MKEFFKMFFASLLAMVFTGLVVIGGIIALIAGFSRSIGEKEKGKTSGNILVIDISKHIHEQGETNSFAVLSDAPAYRAGLYDIVKVVSIAKTDDNIKGILLKLGPSGNGCATMQELRMALKDFRSSGKFIYAYGEHITQLAYYTATAADSIYVNPAGQIELKGLATVIPFLKGTLDKLEVQPEIYYAGKFKSATEPFRAEKISEPNRMQIEAYQKGIWNEILDAAAEYTHTDKATVNQWTVNGLIQFPADALKYKMVAGLLHWDEVEQRIKTKTGLKENEDIKYVSVNDYAVAERVDPKRTYPKIAILFAEGNITDGEQSRDHEIASKNFCEEVRKLRKNDKVKAVVLRVNSPGGSALASDVILRELMLLERKKPLIVSMGDYAASGGYYISCRADSVFAWPNTLTGSIGVFSVLFNMDKMMKNKLGITFDEVKNAPYADVPTVTRPMSPQEAQRLQNSVDTIYSLFKNNVAYGRRLSHEDVDSIAQGRVWTGVDAKNNRLVDGMGGLERAITSAAAMAKLKDYKVVTYPEPEDKLSTLMRRIGANAQSEEAIKSALKEKIGTGIEWYEQLQELYRMNGKAMMAMPFVPRIED
jgi:protease IV